MSSFEFLLQDAKKRFVMEALSDNPNISKLIYLKQLIEQYIKLEREERNREK